MKVLAIHNFHRTGSASGDDRVFKDETKLLEDHGVQVIRYTVCNDEFDKAGLIGKLRATVGMIWSAKHYREVKRIIQREKPDIVHVHTFFPLLSPSILYAAKRSGCKVVATLHDTRFVCPCATSLRGARLCNSCMDGNYFRMCLHGCFKGSRLQSCIVAAAFKYHRIRKTFYNQIDRYICLNEAQIALLKEAGYDPNKIVKKYNFVSDANGEFLEKPKKDLPSRYVVFYGRIGEEKGVRLLMRLWERMADIPLVVMGDGPLKTEFEEWAEGRENVIFLGYTRREMCLSIVKEAEFLIFPSLWYEGCSMVEIETMSLSKGIVATDLGFSSEAIAEAENGFKVPLGNVERFARVIEALWNDPDKCKEIGKAARREYDAKYLPEKSYVQLREIYDVV